MDEPSHDQRVVWSTTQRSDGARVPSVVSLRRMRLKIELSKRRAVAGVMPTTQVQCGSGSSKPTMASAPWPRSAPAASFQPVPEDIDTLGRVLIERRRPGERMPLLAEVGGCGGEHPFHVRPLLAVLPGRLEFGVAHAIGDGMSEFVGRLAPKRKLLRKQIVHGVEQRMQTAQAVDVALAERFWRNGLSSGLI